MADWGSAASGAISGAGVGSAFGPWGTAIGAGVGGLAGLFGGGSKKKKKKVSRLDPRQQQLYDEYVGGLRGEGPNSGMYNFDANAANQNFDQMYSRPAYRNFEENIIPSITGQFRQGNIQNSSYTGGALAKAGRDVQEGLDAHRSNMIYQGNQDAMNRRERGYQNVLGMNTFDYQAPKQNSIDSILSAIGPDAAKMLVNSFSGSGGSSFNGGSLSRTGSRGY